MSDKRNDSREYQIFLKNEDGTLNSLGDIVS
jgi:hypothetical protein